MFFVFFSLILKVKIWWVDIKHIKCYLNNIKELENEISFVWYGNA